MRLRRGYVRPRPGLLDRAANLLLSGVSVQRLRRAALREPADCAEGSGCIPGEFIVDERCLIPQCHSDADCTAAASGVCGLKINDPFQAGTTSVGPIRCSYPEQP